MYNDWIWLCAPLICSWTYSVMVKLTWQQHSWPVLVTVLGRHTYSIMLWGWIPYLVTLGKYTQKTSVQIWLWVSNSPGYFSDPDFSTTVEDESTSGNHSL